MKKILFPTLLITTLVAGGVVAFAIWRATPATAEDLLKDARKYYEEKDYERAAIQLMNAVQQDGTNREARLLLAETFLAKQDYNSAVEQYRKILLNNPDDREALLRMGGIFLMGTAEVKKSAVEIADKLLGNNKDDVEALVLRGNAKAGLRDFTASRADFEHVISL